MGKNSYMRSVLGIIFFHRPDYHVSAGGNMYSRYSGIRDNSSASKRILFENSRTH
jgi:hypothetical protein